MYISEGCPKEKEIISESCPTVHVGGCPKSYFRELSNNSPRRIVQHICSESCPIVKLYRRLTNVFSKTKTFCFEAVFSHLACACVRESMRARDVGKSESHSHPYHIDV